MSRSVAIGVTVAAGLAGLWFLSKNRRHRIGEAVSHRMLRRMERVMARLPEDAPPKLVMNILPRLRDQNEQILRNFTSRTRCCARP